MPEAWRARVPSCLPEAARSLGFYVFLVPHLPASPRSVLLGVEESCLLFGPPVVGSAGNKFTGYGRDFVD